MSDDPRATALRILDEHLDSPTLAAAIADAIRAAVETEQEACYAIAWEIGDLETCAALRARNELRRARKP